MSSPSWPPSASATPYFTFSPNATSNSNSNNNNWAFEGVSHSGVAETIFALGFVMPISVCLCSMYLRRRRLQREQAQAALFSSRRAMRRDRASISTSGLSADELAVLNEFTWSGDATKDDRCIVCLDPLVDGEKIIKLACEHVFHANCVRTWLSDHSLCPLCKADAFGRDLKVEAAADLLRLMQARETAAASRLRINRLRNIVREIGGGLGFGRGDLVTVTSASLPRPVLIPTPTRTDLVVVAGATLSTSSSASTALALPVAAVVIREPEATPPPLPLLSQDSQPPVEGFELATFKRRETV